VSPYSKVTLPVRVITSKLFSSHKPPPNVPHPECPERVELTVELLKEIDPEGRISTFVTPSAEPSKVGAKEARAAALDAVLRVHDEMYVGYVEEVCMGGGGGLDGDTYLAPLSYEIALLAQSAWLDGVDHALATGRPAFALVRPPGHHALRARGMGFCSFNFCAAAAQHALLQSGVERIAILDWCATKREGPRGVVRRGLPDRRACLLTTAPATGMCTMAMASRPSWPTIPEFATAPCTRRGTSPTRGAPTRRGSTATC